MKFLASLFLVLSMAGGLMAQTVWSTGKYRDFDDKMQVLSVNNAKALKVTVTGETECNYDFVYIYDSCGKLVARLSGNINKTLYVKGSSIIAKLKADDSYTANGVTVTVCAADSASASSCPISVNSCNCNSQDPDRDPSYHGGMTADRDVDPAANGMTPDLDVDPSLR